MKSHSTSMRTPWFDVYCERKPGSEVRFGVVARKKVFPLAVERNRARRLLKEALMKQEHLSGGDYLFFPKSELLTIPFHDIVSSVENSLVEGRK